MIEGPSSGGANNFFIFFQKAFGSFCSRLAMLCSLSSWDFFFTLYTNLLYKRLSLIYRIRLFVLLGSLDSWPLYFLNWRLSICNSLYGICLLIFCIFRLLRRNTDLIATLMISVNCSAASLLRGKLVWQNVSNLLDIIGSDNFLRNRSLELSFQFWN